MKCCIALVAALLPVTVSAQVVINEVAWMGTMASANDEWIELFNQTQEAVDMSGWRIESQDGSPSIELVGTVPTRGYFLLERTDDTSVPEIQAGLIYSGVLENAGEKLLLMDAHGVVVDEVDGSKGWPAGDSKNRYTMERSGDSWMTSFDAGGSPGMENSSVKSVTKPDFPRKSGFRIGIPLFPSHFAIALTIALACSLSILVVKRLIGRLISSSSDVPED